MCKEKVQFISYVFIMSLIMLPIYIFLHESGHAIIALLCGAKDIRINILSANMSFEYFETTPFFYSLFNIAGMLFPLIIFSMIIAIFFHKNNTSILYLCCFYVLSIMTIFPIFAWIIVPIIGMIFELPSGDDVTAFILNSGWHPIYVLILACVFIALTILLLTTKGIPQLFVLQLKRFSIKK